MNLHLRVEHYLEQLKNNRETEFDFYKTMVVPILTYSCETWTIIKKNENKLQSQGMSPEEELQFAHTWKGHADRRLENPPKAV